MKSRPLRCFFLVCFAALGVGCFKDNPASTTGTKKQPKQVSPRTRVKPVPRLASLSLEPTWLDQSWLAAIVQDYKVLFPYIGPDVRGSGLYHAATTLRKNNLMDALKKSVPPNKKMSRRERILRGRVLLRAAEFYAELTTLVSSLSEHTYARRFALRKKLQLGKLFSLYQGRAFCLRKKFREAQAKFELAAKTTPDNRKPRLALWKTACVDGAKAEQIGEALSKVDLSKDPDAWADLHLLRAFLGLPVSKKAQTPTPRAELYLALAQQAAKISYPSLRAAMDEETIKENDVDATLEYHDPGLPWLLKRYHAQKALDFFQTREKTDAAAAWLEARALAILGEKTKALAVLEGFLKEPPKSMDWDLQLFSMSLTASDLHLRAKLFREVLKPADDKSAVESLRQLAKTQTTCPARLWIADAWLQRENSKEAYDYVLSCMNTMDTLRKSLDQMIAKPGDGAKFISQTRLTRYALRVFFQVASQAALRFGDKERAMRWMEFLHQKDEPYKIGGDNQAAQILLTARAYLGMSRWGVAYIFLGKNRQTYTSLTQPWALLGTLRIIIGMSANDGGGGPGPKGD